MAFDNFFELDHMTHVYQSGAAEPYEALRSVTLSVAEGEFVAILGANGSGKSTLARHLNALLLPTEGKCLVRGWDTRDESKRWDIRQEVSMVFQNPDNQLIAAVVEDDVAFGPENLGVPPEEIRARVQDALALVGMETHALDAPHLLSGGQKQRTALARALITEPELLLLDEPFSALDADLRTHTRNEVLQIQQASGIPMILITHDRADAEVLADEVWTMEAGRLAAAEDAG